MPWAGCNPPVQCAVHKVQWCTVSCTVYSIQGTLVHSAQCTMHSTWESCPPVRRKGSWGPAYRSPARTTVTLYRASMWNSHLLNTHVVQTPAAQCAAGTRVMYMCLGYRQRYSAQVHWCTDAQGQCTSRWICRYSVNCAVCKASIQCTVYSVMCTPPTGGAYGAGTTAGAVCTVRCAGHHYAHPQLAPNKGHCTVCSVQCTVWTVH